MNQVLKVTGMVGGLLVCLGLVSVVRGADQAPADTAKLTSDQVRMAVQEICPVSGQKLGTHGDPVKVKIGKEEIFLCCKACTTGKVDPKLWATIHANFAKAQQICPVMKNKLPKGAKWTIAEGQVIYVCCPPCIEKIDADPKKYVKDLEALYRTSLQAKQKGNVPTGT